MKTRKSKKFNVWYACLTQKITPRFTTEEGAVNEAVKLAKNFLDGVVVIKAVGFINLDDTYETFKEEDTTYVPV